MPQIEANPGPELGIRLDGSNMRYSPGDTVTGYVYRTTPTALASAHIAISLHGISESWIVVSAGYSSQKLVAELNLFDPGKTTQVLHHDKALVIDPDGGEARWPFAINIPFSAEHKSVVAPDAVQEHSYLPLSPDAVAAEQIPSVFNVGGYALGGLVQYYLQAELQLPGKSRILGRDKTNVHKAFLPLRVERVSPGPPISDFKLKREPRLQKISSQRLNPGMEDAKLSFSQKTQKAFGSSKVPTLVFKVHIDVPTVLQMENEDYVPFHISLEPIWDRTSEAIRGQFQNIRLDSIAVRVKPVTDVRVKDGKTKSRSASYASEKVDLISLDAGSLEGNVNIPWVAGDAPVGISSNESKTPPLDVGKLGNFSLSGQALKAMERRSLGIKPLYHSFTSYKIKHSHELSWELRGSVAGEKIQIRDKHGVTLLPPPSLGDKGAAPPYSS